MLQQVFFDRDAELVAQALLGKIMRVRQGNVWRAGRIIETEAYYLEDKASHSALGYTEKRRALFMAPGTIYMYYARGADSLNISCKGEGNAVLIKSAVPHPPTDPSVRMGGQTLLCRALGLKVPEWNAQPFDPERFYLEDIGYQPQKIIQTTRLGIPKGRDEHLPYRFIDYDEAKNCTSNPLAKRGWKEGVEYVLINGLK